MTRSQWSLGLALLLATAFAFASVALHSGFPLIYSDAGTYIRTGYTLELPWDRPLTYGLFLRLTSLARSPWNVVFVQAVLLSWAVLAAFRSHTRIPSPMAVGFLASLALAYVTAIGVTASHLTPDVFAPIAILCFAWLVSRPDGAPAIEVAAHAVLLLLASIVSLSHLAMVTGLWSTYLVAGLIGKQWAGFRVRRIALTGAVTVAGWLAIPTIHAAAGAGFRYPPGGSVFFVGRLAEAGILTDLLESECPTRSWRICDSREAIPPSPDEFIWADSAFTRAGGATEANFREYAAITRTALTTPRWLGRSIAAAWLAWLRQLTLFDNSWVAAYAEDEWLVVREVQERYPSHRNEFLRSRQRLGKLDLGPLDARQYAAVAAAILLLGALLAVPRWRGRIDRRLGTFWWSVVMGIALNAAVCGALNTPAPRYGNRVMFLLPLLAMIASCAVWLPPRRPQAIPLAEPRPAGGGTEVPDGRRMPSSPDRGAVDV
jgi:hypothetical protein